MKEFCTLLLLLLPNWILGQSLQEIFKQANIAYSNEKFAEAAQLYEQVVSSNRVSAHLYYNLGNAYFKQKKVGPAILNYERALRLSPKDKDTNKNLAMANTLVIKKINTYPMLFYKRWWLNVLHTFSSGWWAFGALICVWSSLFLGVSLVRQTITQRRRQAFLAIFGLTVLAAMCNILAYNKYIAESNQDYVVVMSEEVALKMGPGANSQDATFLSAGIKARIIDRVDDWFKVVLTDEQEGWLQKVDLEVI